MCPRLLSQPGSILITMDWLLTYYVNENKTSPGLATHQVYDTVGTRKKTSPVGLGVWVVVNPCEFRIAARTPVDRYSSIHFEARTRLGLAAVPFNVSTTQFGIGRLSGTCTRAWPHECIRRNVQSVQKHDSPWNSEFLALQPANGSAWLGFGRQLSYLWMGFIPSQTIVCKPH